MLAQDRWRERPLTVTFFGKGVNRQQIERLAEMLGVKNVRFGGFVSGVSDIWKDHHAAGSALSQRGNADRASRSQPLRPPGHL